MSGTTVRVGRLIALWLLAAVLAPAGWISIPAASAGQGKMFRQPTLLWKSYPLKQRPSATEQAQAGLGSRQPGQQPTLLRKSRPLKQRPSATEQAQAGLGSRQAGQQRSPEPKQLRNALLLSVLATLVAVAVIVLMRSSLPARVAGFRRARDGAKIRGPGRRPFGAKPSWRTRRRPPLREVNGEPVAEPHAPPTRPVVPEPGDDLLEALHPKPPSAPEPEAVSEQAVVEEPRRAPTPKHEGGFPVEQQRTAQPKPVQTRNPPLKRDWEPEQERTRELPLESQPQRLVERMQTAPASEREQLEPEIDLLHGRIKARQPSEPELDRRRDQELRTFIDEAHAVPETNGKAKTEVEPPPQRQRAHQTATTVESCEIRLWRGFVKCQLYATFRGSKEACPMSRHFRLRDEEAPSAGAQRALADLLAELERGGWTVVSDGAIWYQHRLQRFAPRRPSLEG